MNKKKEIIKLVLYLICLAISIYLFFRIKAVGEQQWVCITSPCPQIDFSDVLPWLIVSLLSSIVFIILSIRSIIRIKKK